MDRPRPRACEFGQSVGPVQRHLGCFDPAPHRLRSRVGLSITSDAMRAARCARPPPAGARPGWQLAAQDCGSSLLPKPGFVCHSVAPKPMSAGRRRGAYHGRSRDAITLLSDDDPREPAHQNPRADRLGRPAEGSGSDHSARAHVNAGDYEVAHPRRGPAPRAVHRLRRAWSAGAVLLHRRSGCRLHAACDALWQLERAGPE